MRGTVMEERCEAYPAVAGATLYVGRGPSGSFSTASSGSRSDGGWSLRVSEVSEGGLAAARAAAYGERERARKSNGGLSERRHAIPVSPVSSFADVDRESRAETVFSAVSAAGSGAQSVNGIASEGTCASPGCKQLRSTPWRGSLEFVQPPPEERVGTPRRRKLDVGMRNLSDRSRKLDIHLGSGRPTTPVVAKKIVSKAAAVVSKINADGLRSSSSRSELSASSSGRLERMNSDRSQATSILPSEVQPPAQQGGIVFVPRRPEDELIQPAKRLLELPKGAAETLPKATPTRLPRTRVFIEKSVSAKALNGPCEYSGTADSLDDSSVEYDASVDDEEDARVEEDDELDEEELREAELRQEELRQEMREEELREVAAEGESASIVRSVSNHTGALCRRMGRSLNKALRSVSFGQQEDGDESCMASNLSSRSGKSAVARHTEREVRAFSSAPHRTAGRRQADAPVRPPRPHGRISSKNGVEAAEMGDFNVPVVDAEEVFGYDEDHSVAIHAKSQHSAERPRWGNVRLAAASQRFNLGYSRGPRPFARADLGPKQSGSAWKFADSGAREPFGSGGWKFGKVAKKFLNMGKRGSAELVTVDHQAEYNLNTVRDGRSEEFSMDFMAGTAERAAERHVRDNARGGSAAVKVAAKAQLLAKGRRSHISSSQYRDRRDN